MYFFATLLTRGQNVATSIINDGFGAPGFQAGRGLGIALLSHVYENGQQQKKLPREQSR
jgi:hypothetical protein